MVRTGTVIGTYLHGPLLPKNGWFADWLTATALGRDRRRTRPARRHARGRRARRRPPCRRGLTGEAHQSGGVASAAPSPGLPRDQATHRPARGAVRLPRSRGAGVRRGDQALPRRRRPAVDKLSLKVPAGEICVLVGPSGCGKTTAMRMVNRMIDITGGDILVGGRSVKDRDVDDLRREIGYVIQQIGLFPHRTIGDNIATVPRLLGWDKQRIAARVEELIDLIGLPQEMAGATRRSSPAASASASASPARSPPTRR